VRLRTASHISPSFSANLPPSIDVAMRTPCHRRQLLPLLQGSVVPLDGERHVPPLGFVGAGPADRQGLAF